MRGFVANRRTLVWLLGRVMGLWVRPTALPLDRVEVVRSPGRRVLYVIERRSLADLIALTLVCARQGLPAPARRLKLANGHEAQSVVALEHRRGLFRSRLDRRVPERLVRVMRDAASTTESPVDLVPVSVFWGRAPGSERSGLALWFREDWRIVGPFRRLVTTLVHGRNTLVHFGEAIAVREMLGPDLDAGRGARRALRTLRGDVRRTRVAIIGPDLARRRTVIAAVLKQRAVRVAMALEARDGHATRRQVLDLAATYVHEIAADYSPRFVAVMSRVLARVWQRLYDGVEVLHPERLDLAASGARVVYVPCHRSHMDYLLLSYVIYRRGYAAPYVAAGINLNLPIVGRFLRKGGAFFLRRSFKGNALYPIVFMSYLRVMMGRGHPIQYFIEGGRSRTGRLLRPKTGMLSMTVRSFLSDPARPVYFVPVYFGYERLVEARTYVSELSGRPKQKESIGGLLRALRVLRERFGRVYVSFGEPLSLGDHLDVSAPGWTETASQPRPPWLGPAVDSLARVIQSRVNSAAAVSPISLLSLALLSTPRQAMPESDLVRQLDLYRRLAEAVPYSADVWCTPLSGEDILSYGRAMGLVETVPHALGAVVRMSESNAVVSAYYRNNVLHIFALPSLIACAFMNNEAVRTEDLQRLMARIYPYVAQELFLHWTEAEVWPVVSRLLEALMALGLLSKTDDGLWWRRPATASAEAVQLSHLAHATLEVVERYYLAIALLLQSGPRVITQDMLEQRCQQAASRMALLYELHSPEFFDRDLFRQFVTLLKERGLIGVDSERHVVFGDELSAVARDARFVLSAQIQHSVLQVTHG